MEATIKIKGIHYWGKDEEGIDNTLKEAISHCFDISKENIEVLKVSL